MFKYYKKFSGIVGGVRKRINAHSKHTLTENKYVPRRACLYVPGNDMKKINKITQINADCVILDCEDGVALNRKDEARKTIQNVLDNLSFGYTEPIVRVNSLTSGLAEEDLKVTLAVKKLPPTLMLPKVESANHLDQFSELLKTALHTNSHHATFNLIIFIESAVGMLNLPTICERAKVLAGKECGFTLSGLVFGSDDFCADIGANRSADGMELIYARQKLVLIAKAYRLQAIDMVHIDYKDLEGLRRYSEQGASMGFTGKQCIHPGQVQIVQQAFSPSKEKIEWASELVKAFEEHQSSGKGAFTFRGHMIDMPLLLQAKNILQLAQSIHTEQPTT